MNSSSLKLQNHSHETEMGCVCLYILLKAKYFNTGKDQKMKGCVFFSIIPFCLILPLGVKRIRMISTCNFRVTLTLMRGVGQSSVLISLFGVLKCATGNADQLKLGSCIVTLEEMKLRRVRNSSCYLTRLCHPHTSSAQESCGKCFTRSAFRDLFCLMENNELRNIGQQAGKL